MKTLDALLADECRRLRAMENGLVGVFDLLEEHVRSREVAVTITMLIEAADRHLLDLEEILTGEEWPFATEEETPLAQAWREEVNRHVLDAAPGPETDTVCLGLLRGAVGLRLPCYESAWLYALYAERPRIARTLRLAIEDEQASMERLRSAAEQRVSLRSCLGQGGGLS